MLGQGFGIAEVEHEPRKKVVPVVVCGHAVDPARIVLVRNVEAVDVVVHVSGRVDDVADDDHELRVVVMGDHLGDRVLRSVSLPCVADEEERPFRRQPISRIDRERARHMTEALLSRDPSGALVGHDAVIACDLVKNVVDHLEEALPRRPEES
jgi:hypothetical protein